MGKFSKYSLPLKSLSKGTHEFDYKIDTQFFVDMESQDVCGAALDAAVTVRYDGIAYDLSFAVTGEVTVQCDRCLDEMQQPVNATYHIVVKYGDSYRDDSDELLEIPERDSALNISYMLYDTVELAIPLKHVHPAGKCNRAMSALLKRHTSPGVDGEDEPDDFVTDMTDNIPDIDETDSID